MTPDDRTMTKDRSTSRAALTRAISGSIPLIIYHWNGWPGYVIDKLSPKAIVREASPSENVRKLLDSLPVSPGVFLFHLNCSITEAFPSQRQELLAALDDRGWVTCNEEVVDISKRGIQARLVDAGCRSVLGRQEGPPEELMVIKSNYNYGGKNESLLPENIQTLLGVEHISTAGLNYTTSRRAEIQEDAWSDPSLTIERFVGNERGHYFRAWVAGERTHLVELHCPDNIKKIGISRLMGIWSSQFDSHSPLPDPAADRVMTEVIKVSVALGLDFGALDVMVNDEGEPFVVDVNTTPWFRLHPGWEVSGFPDYVHHLSAGSAKALSFSRSLLRPLRVWRHS